MHKQFSIKLLTILLQVADKQLASAIVVIKSNSDDDEWTMTWSDVDMSLKLREPVCYVQEIKNDLARCYLNVTARLDDTYVLKSQVFTYDGDITRFLKSFNDAAMQVVLKIRVAKHKMHAPWLSIVDGGLLINENAV